MAEWKSLFVASNVYIIPIFKPFMQLIYRSLVSNKVFNSCWLIEVCPHCMWKLSFLHFYGFPDFVRTLILIDSQWFSGTQSKVWIAWFLPQEILKLLFCEDNSAVFLSGVVLGPLCDLSAVLHFVSNYQIVSFTTNCCPSSSTKWVNQILQFLTSDGFELTAANK